MRCWLILVDVPYFCTAAMMVFQWEAYLAQSKAFQLHTYCDLIFSASHCSHRLIIDKKYITASDIGQNFCCRVLFKQTGCTLLRSLALSFSESRSCSFSESGYIATIGAAEERIFSVVDTDHPLDRFASSSFPSIEVS